MSEQLNVFVSHQGKDDDNIGKIMELLEENGMVITNNSDLEDVSDEEPDDVHEEDTDSSITTIDCADAVVIPIYPKTTTMLPNNDQDIIYANSRGKKIIGVYLPGASSEDVPAGIDKFGNALIPLDGKKIIDAIHGKNNDFETPTGEPRTPTVHSERGTCH